MTNGFIFAYAHQSQIVDVATGTDPATYDRDKLGFKFSQVFPVSNLRNRFPGFNCGVGSCSFNSFPSEWRNTGNDYGWTDNLTAIRGKHTFKTGIYFNLDDKGQQPSWSDAGSFDFIPNRFNPNDSNKGCARRVRGGFVSELERIVRMRCRLASVLPTVPSETEERRLEVDSGASSSGCARTSTVLTRWEIRLCCTRLKCLPATWIALGRPWSQVAFAFRLRFGPSTNRPRLPPFIAGRSESNGSSKPGTLWMSRTSEMWATICSSSEAATTCLWARPLV